MGDRTERRKKIKVLAIDSAALTQRVQELLELGLPDDASVQQYAINSLSKQVSNTQAGDQCIFVTRHVGILAKASVLSERYGLRPVRLEEVCG